jgi:hypothetical protein
MDHFSKNGYFIDSFLFILHFQAGNHYFINNNLPEKLPYPIIFFFPREKTNEKPSDIKSRIVQI